MHTPAAGHHHRRSPATFTHKPPSTTDHYYLRSSATTIHKPRLTGDHHHYLLATICYRLSATTTALWLPLAISRGQPPQPIVNHHHHHRGNQTPPPPAINHRILLATTTASRWPPPLSAIVHHRPSASLLPATSNPRLLANTIVNCLSPIASHLPLHQEVTPACWPPLRSTTPSNNLCSINFKLLHQFYFISN